MKWAPEASEAAGTFMLVFCATGAIMVDALTGAIGHVGVALAFGLVVGAMIYATGHISGAHFNPAVTIAFAVTGHFPWRRALGYIGAQLAGATLASMLLRLMLGNVAGMGGTHPSPLLDSRYAMGMEFILTASLMFVIASVATDGRAQGQLAGLAIGGTVGLHALWAGPLTGASMNPARSIGPAIAAADFGDLGMYLLGPILGAVVGALAYEVLRRGDRPRTRRSQ